MAPEYLRRLVPPTIQSTTMYPFRNGDHLIVPFCRHSLTNSSFIPTTVKEWNIAIRKLDSLSKFFLTANQKRYQFPNFITMAIES